jgi:hypothetical protein
MEPTIVEKLDNIYPYWRINPKKVLGELNFDQTKKVIEISKYENWEQIVLLTKSQDVMIWALNHIITLHDLSKIAFKIASNNFLDALWFLVSKGCNNSKFWNAISFGAAYENNTNILGIALGKGANNWNRIASYGIRKGHENILKTVGEENITNWNNIGHSAAQNGSEKMVKYSIGKGGDDYNHMATGAAKNGHLNIIKMLVSYNINNWSAIAEKAAIGGHLAVVKFAYKSCIESGGCGINLVNIAAYAAQNNHIDIMTFAIDNIKGEIPDAIGYIAAGAAYGGYLPLLKVLTIGRLIDWNIMAYAAADGGQLEVLMYSVDMGAHDWKMILSFGMNKHHTEIVQYVNNKTCISSF